MKQYTFMMLKPDAFINHHQEDIIQMLKENHLVIEKSAQLEVTMEVMQTLLFHYQQVIDEKGKDFNFPGRLFNTFYFDGPHYIMPMCVSYEGEEDIITYTRHLVGKTNPIQASPDSIRGKYSQDSYVKADQEFRLVNNVIHASSSHVDVSRELEIWEKYF